MKILKREIKFSLFWLVIVLLVLLSLLLFKQWQVENDSKLNGIYGGLLTGLIIAILQLFLSWYEYKEIARFKKMQVVDIRPDRDDRKFYEQIIKKSSSKIYVMGVTASRFLSHFADLNSDRAEARVLLSAMDRGVNVRILMPEVGFLSGNQASNAAQAHEIIIALQAEYKDKFMVRYFKHAAAHSIFMFDNECILGPVFPMVSSKDTPAIQLKNTSPYAKKYLDYFKHEWEHAL